MTNYNDVKLRVLFSILKFYAQRMCVYLIVVSFSLYDHLYEYFHLYIVYLGSMPFKFKIQYKWK